jgi:hypothetical protein
LSAITSHRIRTRHHRRHRTKDGNLYFQFAKALILELAAVPDVEIDKCLPASWKSAKPTDPEDKEGTESSKGLEEQKTGWSGVLDKLGKAINFVCKLKDLVKQIIEYFTKENTKKYRRYMRLFLQGKTSRLRRVRWGFAGLITGAKDLIKSGAESIKKGVIKVKDAVTTAIDNVEEYVTKTLKETFSPIVDLFEAMKAKVTAFMQHPLIQKLISFVNCIKTFKGFAANLIAIVSSWISLIGELATPAGWVKLVIKMICAWEDLAKAIGYLKEAFVKGVTAPVKWQKIGQFLGKLIYTIGNDD